MQRITTAVKKQLGVAAVTVVIGMLLSYWFSCRSRSDATQAESLCEETQAGPCPPMYVVRPVQWAHLLQALQLGANIEPEPSGLNLRPFGIGDGIDSTALNSVAQLACLEMFDVSDWESVFGDLGRPLPLGRIVDFSFEDGSGLRTIQWFFDQRVDGEFHIKWCANDHVASSRAEMMVTALGGVSFDTEELVELRERMKERGSVELRGSRSSSTIDNKIRGFFGLVIRYDNVIVHVVANHLRKVDVPVTAIDPMARHLVGRLIAFTER